MAPASTPRNYWTWQDYNLLTARLESWSSGQNPSTILIHNRFLISSEMTRTYLKIALLGFGRHSGLDPESSDFVILLLLTGSCQLPICNSESRWIPAFAGMTNFREVLRILARMDSARSKKKNREKKNVRIMILCPARRSINWPNGHIILTLTWRIGGGAGNRTPDTADMSRML